MKKTCIIISLMLFPVILAFGQNKDNIIKYQGAAKRAIGVIEKSPKNAEKFYYQLDAAEALTELYDLNTNRLSFSVRPADLEKIYLGVKPLNVEEKTEGEDKVVIYHYPYIDLTFINGLLRSWELTNLEIDHVLDKALVAVKQATALNKRTDSEATNKLERFTTTIRQAYNVGGFANYFAKKYAEAYKSTVIYLDLLSKTRDRDTTAQIYSVYYAEKAGMNDELLESFNKTVALNYREKKDNEGQMFLFAYKVYMDRKDTINALKTMQKGVEYYPGNYDIIIKLIDLYRDMNQNGPAIDFLHQAQLLNPDNSLLFLIEASLQQELGKDSLTLALYRKVLTMDPENYRATLNIAAAEYEKAKAMLLAIDDIKDNKLYVERRDLALAQMNLVVPLLEKAAKLNPDPADNDISLTLKAIYYQLRIKYPEYEAKFKAMEEKYPSQSKK